MLVKLDHFPKFRGENVKNLWNPPSNNIFCLPLSSTQPPTSIPSPKRTKSLWRFSTLWGWTSNLSNVWLVNITPPTWMSQEVSKRLVSRLYPQYTPFISWAGYNPVTNLLLTSWDIQAPNILVKPTTRLQHPPFSIPSVWFIVRFVPFTTKNTLKLEGCN